MKETILYLKCYCMRPWILNKFTQYCAQEDASISGNIFQIHLLGNSPVTENRGNVALFCAAGPWNLSEFATLHQSISPLVKGFRTLKKSGPSSATSLEEFAPVRERNPPSQKIPSNFDSPGLSDPLSCKTPTIWIPLGDRGSAPSPSPNPRLGAKIPWGTYPLTREVRLGSEMPWSALRSRAVQTPNLAIALGALSDQLFLDPGRSIEAREIVANEAHAAPVGTDSEVLH